MWILAKLLALVTGHERYFPEIRWSDKSWTHNVFRVYESVFGRREGIRCEVTAWRDDRGVQHYMAHSFEACLAVAETYVREFLSQRKFVPFRVYIPLMQTPQGFPIPASPYVFAIAVDATASGSGDATTASKTWSHSCTGSNLIIMMYAYQSAVTAYSTISYNTVGGTQIQSPQGDASSWWVSMWYLLAPATGSNTVSADGTNLQNKNGTSVSYTGVQQSGQPDSSNVGQSAASASLTVSTTVVASNCWLVGAFISSNNTASAGAGTTLRISATSTVVPAGFDSNATVGTNSQSLVMNPSVSAHVGGIVASIAPFVAATSTRDARLLTLLGLG